MRPFTLFLREAILSSNRGLYFLVQKNWFIAWPIQLAPNTLAIVIELDAETGAITAVLLDQKNLYRKLIVSKLSKKVRFHLTQCSPKLNSIHRAPIDVFRYK